MQFASYLRDQAKRYRMRAEGEPEPAERGELITLAAICEEVASSIEDQSASG